VLADEHPGVVNGVRGRRGAVRDLNGGRRLRAEGRADGVAEGDVEGLVAFGEGVLSEEQVEGLLCLARCEAQGAEGCRVVGVLARRRV
jgi:hypothetical protein